MPTLQNNIGLFTGLGGFILIVLFLGFIWIQKDPQKRWPQLKKKLRLD